VCRKLAPGIKDAKRIEERERQYPGLNTPNRRVGSLPGSSVLSGPD